MVAVLDAADEAAADIAFMHETVADLKPPLGDEMRHARGRAGAAGAAIDRAFAIEYRVAAVGAFALRLCRPTAHG